MHSKQLVLRAMHGETQAFGELVQKYRPLVYSLVLSRTRQPEDVEELVQEVFCRAFEELDGLRQPELFGGWLRRIAANMVVSWWRRQQRGGQIVQEYARQNEGRNIRPDENHEATRRVSELRGALGRLSDPYRRVLQLYYWERCSYQEISAVLGVPETTVKWRLLHGRSTLRTYLN
jgi:RNA polymerase sigma-70 factor, ECF subfamily